MTIELDRAAALRRFDRTTGLSIMNDVETRDGGALGRFIRT